MQAYIPFYPLTEEALHFGFTTVWVNRSAEVLPPAAAYETGGMEELTALLDIS